MSLSAVVLVTPALHGSAGVGGNGSSDDASGLPVTRDTLHLPSPRSPFRPPACAPFASVSQNAALEPGAVWNKHPLPLTVSPAPPPPPPPPRPPTRMGVGVLVGVFVGVGTGAPPVPDPDVPPAPCRIRSMLNSVIGTGGMIENVFVPAFKSERFSGTAMLRGVKVKVSGYGHANMCAWPLTV